MPPFRRPQEATVSLVEEPSRARAQKSGVQELRRYPVNSEGAGDQRAGCVSREATLYCALHHEAAA